MVIYQAFYDVVHLGSNSTRSVWLFNGLEIIQIAWQVKLIFPFLHSKVYDEIVLYNKFIFWVTDARFYLRLTFKSQT